MKQSKLGYQPKFTPYRLKRMRETAGMTQQDLADYLGCCRDLVTKWEQARYSVPERWDEKLLHLEITSKRKRERLNVLEKKAIIMLKKFIDDFRLEAFKLTGSPIDRKTAVTLLRWAEANLKEYEAKDLEMVKGRDIPADINHGVHHITDPDAPPIQDIGI